MYLQVVINNSELRPATLVAQTINYEYTYPLHNHPGQPQEENMSPSLTNF